MIKKYKFFIIPLACIALFILGGSLFLNDWLQNGLQAEELRKDLSATDEYMDVSKITRFSWEKLYIFPPKLTSSYLIDRTLGFPWPDYYPLYSMDEAHGFYTLFLFTENNRVVEAIQVPNTPVSFASCFRESGYAYDEARFIRIGDYRKWTGRK